MLPDDRNYTTSSASAMAGGRIHAQSLKVRPLSAPRSQPIEFGVQLLIHTRKIFILVRWECPGTINEDR
jgi:hypothetical protein